MNGGYVAIAPGVEWREIDGSVLVLHDEILHVLSDSSAEIWQAIDGSMSTSELAALLSERHPESTQVSDDVAGFVSDLTQRGLLVRQEQPVGNGYRVPGHVAWAPEDDGSVAVADLRAGRRHSLAPTGGTIWTMTVASASTELIERALLEVFPDAPDGYADDIRQLRASLLEEGLLEHRP